MACGVLGNVININVLSKLNLPERWIVAIPCIASAIGLGLLVLAFGGIDDSERWPINDCLALWLGSSMSYLIR